MRKVQGFLIFMIFLCNFLFVTQPSLAGEAKHIKRFPAIHEGSGTIVFVYGEDIWKVSSTGGTAVRLTIDDGSERFPRISPDGGWVAFTGEYDGNADVYVMNIHGGNITRLTYHPGSDDVVGWHPNKNKIIFRSNRLSFSRFSRLFMVNPDGSDIEPLILHEGAFASFSPNGKQIAYNKVRREHRTWKRYKGGKAQDIYIYDFTGGEEKRITDFPGTDRAPMWIGDKIYFSSDRDEVLNIYSYDPGSRKVERITFHSDYDIRRPSQGKHSIVYELGGELWVLDVRTKKTAKVPVEIRSDAPETRPYVKNVENYVTGFDSSPSGKRALLVARGEIFTVPCENGPTRNLTNDPGARDKDAAWSPDGNHIAYLSDKSGEYEIYLIDAQGRKKAVKLTQHKNGYRHTLRWSPDSKKIAFTDQTLSLYFIDIASRKITTVDKAEFENIDVSLDVKPIYDFSWSPDSRFLTYSKMDADLVTKVYVYSLDSGKINGVSTGLFNDFNPVFSRDGQHLFFISNRRFSPTYCDFEWEMVYKKLAGIYCVTLRKDGKPLLPHLSDEEEVNSGKIKKRAEKGKKKGKKKSKPNINGKPEVHVRIDFDGIVDRIEMLPLPRGNYRSLAVTDEAIFYLNKDEGDFNRFEYRSIGAMNLFYFHFEDREEESIIKAIDGYKLSLDGTQILYRKGNKFGFYEWDDWKSKMKPFSTSGLTMNFEPLKEWRQVFNEAWRMERDFYYDSNMKGIDWLAMKKKYAQLLPYASCRQDIRYLIGELIGELNTSHTYIYGGDHKRRGERVNVGMLGANFQIDAANKKYRFKKILRVSDWSREITPPLSGSGIHVKVGDYLLSVNGKPVTAAKNIYNYFQDLAGKQVRILVNSTPHRSGAREYVVKPLHSERRLRYLDWVEHNRMVVSKASNGQIGYMHFPDTFNGSAIEFPKYWYSQTRKKGLIVDGRFNGGGLDPDIFFRRLQNKTRSYWTRRYSKHQVGPPLTTRAHMVCLTNRYAGSGGDEFPHLFRDRGMGPVIGTRTWGGLVGVSMSIPLIDGGGLTAPDYRIYDTEGNWIIENIGVAPDIEVDLTPSEVARGFDAQLMKGVGLLLKKIKEDPRPFPKHKPLPLEKLKRQVK
jgi:tricorn protease